MTRLHPLTRRPVAVGIPLAAALLALPAWAQYSGGGGATAPADQAPRLERADRKFIENALEASMGEVALGRVGSQQASDPQVKAFAEAVVRDHGAAQQELASLAGSKGVDMPKEASRSDKRDAERLAKLSGPEFDRAFMKQMTVDHRSAVKDFERAAKTAKDVELRSFVTKTLPTLQNHLKSAQSLEGAIAK